MNQTTQILTLTDVNFQELVLENEQVPLVIFEKDWFGGVHILMPVMKYLAEKYKNQLIVGRFNFDDDDRIPKKYGISDTMSILVFKNGRLKFQFFGMIDRNTLEKEVVALL